MSQACADTAVFSSVIEAKVTVQSHSIIETDTTVSFLQLLRRPVYALLYMAIFASAYYSSRMLFTQYASYPYNKTIAPITMEQNEGGIAAMQELCKTPDVVVQPERKMKTVTLQPTIMHRRHSRKTRNRSKNVIPSGDFPIAPDQKAITLSKSMTTRLWEEVIVQRVWSWMSQRMLFIRRVWTGQC